MSIATVDREALETNVTGTYSDVAARKATANCGVQSVFILARKL